MSSLYKPEPLEWLDANHSEQEEDAGDNEAEVEEA